MLNDFRLVIPLDELQRYADQLILFWVGRNGTISTASRPGTPGPNPNSTTPHPHPSTSYFSQSGVHDTATFTSHDRRRDDQGPNLASIRHQQELSEGSTGGGGLPLTSERRPRSIRSQPSSSGTSVTSTITPGTPSTPTPRDSDDGGAITNSESNSEVEEDDDERERDRDEVRMEED